MRQSLPHMHSNKVRLGSYHFWYQPGPVHTGRLDVLEEVDHTLSLQTLQLGVDGDEGSRATHTITEWCVCVCVVCYIVCVSICTVLYAEDKAVRLLSGKM